MLHVYGLHNAIKQLFLPKMFYKWGKNVDKSYKILIKSKKFKFSELIIIIIPYLNQILHLNS